MISHIYCVDCHKFLGFRLSQVIPLVRPEAQDNGLPITALCRTCMNTRMMDDYVVSSVRGAESDD